MLMDAYGIAKILSVQKSTVYKIARRKGIKPVARQQQKVYFPGDKFPFIKFINLYNPGDFLNKKAT